MITATLGVDVTVVVHEARPHVSATLIARDQSGEPLGSWAVSCPSIDDVLDAVVLGVRQWAQEQIESAMSDEVATRLAS